MALVGVGLRSNQEACDQLMQRNWLGTDRLAIVRDDFEQHQVSCSMSSAMRQMRHMSDASKGLEGGEEASDASPVSFIAN